MKLRWCLISVVVLSSILFGIIGCGGGTASSQQAERNLVISRSGTGYENTSPFTIKSKPWAISWAYSPGPYDLEFFTTTVYDYRMGHIVDVVFSTPDKYSGYHYVYATGTFYLAITGSNYAVEVWEFR